MQPAQAAGEGRTPLPFSFRALILDMDGVLADTEPLHQRAWDAALEGVPLEQVAAARARWVGMASVDIVKELIRAFGLTTPAAQLLAKKRAAYRAMIGVAGPLLPFPGVCAELALWKGFPLALATSGIREEVLLVLEILGLAGTFDPIVTATDVPRAKPAPDCYLRAAAGLGVEPRDCAVVEDSEHGIGAAVAAGMHVLAVSPHADAALQVPPGAEAAFSSTAEALRWLRFF
jgi:beta-phosphoglucomutase-like phosphatase (HAD superfamily)